MYKNLLYSSLLVSSLLVSSLSFGAGFNDFRNIEPVSNRSYLSEKDYHYFYGDNGSDIGLYSEDKSLKFSKKVSRGLVNYLNSDGSLNRDKLQKDAIVGLTGALGHLGVDFFYGDGKYGDLKNSFDDMRSFYFGDCNRAKIYYNKVKLDFCSNYGDIDYNVELKRTGDGFFVNFELDF